MVIDGGRWRTVALIMPQCTTDSPVNIAQSRKFLELSSESLSIQPRPSPPSCSGPAPFRSIAPTAPSLLSSLWELPLTTAGTGNARRLCPLDMNLLQGENSPGTEELPR
jgi:hypothetical protein